MGKENTENTPVEVEDKEQIELNLVKDMFNIEETAAAAPTPEDTEETETAPDDPKPTETERVSKVLANITKREKELAARQKELNEKNKEYEDWKSSKDLLNKDVFKFLEKHGYTLDDLANQVLKTYDPQDPVKVLTEKIQKLEQEQMQSKQEQLIQDFKEDLYSFLDENKNDFPIIHGTDNTSLVYDYISWEAQNSGAIPDLRSAAEEVERELLKYAEVLDSTRKPKQEEETTEKRKSTSKSRTLTNNKTKFTKDKPTERTQEDINKEAEDIIIRTFFDG